MHHTTRKIALLTLGILLTTIKSIAQLDCVNNPTYGDPPPANYFNTGTDGNGGTLPGGSPDLHWECSTTGINGPYSPAIVMSPLPGPYYLSPWPDCAWIAHSQSGAHNVDQDFYYRFTFDLTCFNSCHESYSDPGVFCLNLDFFADNSVYEIRINGVVQNIPGMPVANAYYYTGYAQANMVTVSLCNDWQPGTNEIIIRVASGVPYEGFLAQASTNVPPPIIDTFAATICNGDSLTFGPDVLTTAGTYTHTFASQTGCDSTVALILSVNPSYNDTVSQAICAGDSFLYAGTYYKVAGTYAYAGTTTLGCDSIKVLALTVNQTTMAATRSNVLCNGGSTGSITVNQANNPPGYTYALNAGPYGTPNTFTGLTAGSYTVHTKSAAGCIRDTVITITEPTPIAITNVATVVPLCNDAFGTFTITASGGTPGYTYALDAGTYGASSTLSGVAIGSHTIHVKDANGCIKDSTITMNGPAVITSSISITNQPCFGQTLGVIDVTGAGGTAPYTYALNAGPFGPSGNFSGLAAGTFTVHILDSHNCDHDTIVQVTQPAMFESDIDVTQISCYGDADGSIIIVPNGGTPPFTYSLNGGPYGPNNAFTNLPASINHILAKDNNGCMIDTTIVLPQVSKVTIGDMLVTNVKCAGGMDGKVEIFALGGTPGYTYAADAGLYQNGHVLTGMIAGQHTIHVKDMHGCIADTVVDISQPTPVGFSSVTLSNAICEGDKNGTALIKGMGGTPSYTYSANGTDFAANNYFTGLAMGTYRYYISDSLGCKTDTTITINENPHIVISDAGVTLQRCFGTGDAAIEVNATGGVPPLSYQLNGNPSAPQAGNIFSNLPAGTYTVTVTDSNNCKKNSTVTVRQTAALNLKMRSNGNLCEGVDDNGAVYVDVTGGTPPYTYFWSTDSLNASFRNGITALGNGSYNVRVVDAHDCMAWGKADVEYNNCCTPYVPNAFTPNDDGKNDFFRPVYKGDMFLENMIIYNRYGQQVFNTTDIKAAWDGTFNNVPQDMGTYYLYLVFYCGEGYRNKQIIKTDITLIR